MNRLTKAQRAQSLVDAESYYLHWLRGGTGISYEMSWQCLLEWASGVVA